MRLGAVKALAEVACFRAALNRTEWCIVKEQISHLRRYRLLILQKHKPLMVLVKARPSADPGGMAG